MGGRSSGGGKSARSSSSSSVKNTSASVTTEEGIDKLKFKKLGDGFDYTLSTGNAEIGDIKINKETVGGYSITYHDNEGIEDVDVVETLNDAKSIAREYLKGKWRTIIG